MNQTFVPSNLTRRQFLKASGVTGLAVLGSSLYGGSFPNVLEAAPVKAASDVYKRQVGSRICRPHGGTRRAGVLSRR